MGDVEKLEIDESEAIGRRSRRVAVSAKSYRPEDLNNRAREKFPKSEEAMERIGAKLETNFLFSHLDEEGRRDLSEAVFETKFENGEIIIQQGAEGDNFYIVEEGDCEIFVNDELVMKCGPGDSFGELALMYNAPRAATVQAVTTVVCWAMPQDTFKLTLMETTLKKRDKYEAFLEDVPILSSLLKYERLTIADALVPKDFAKGDVIVKQGDEGDNFYIVERGNCNIFVNEKEMGEIEAGGYFGELALMFDAPRAATIVAASDMVRVLALDRSTFTGVMGSLHSILKRNSEQYKQYEAKFAEAGQ